MSWASPSTSGLGARSVDTRASARWSAVLVVSLVLATGGAFLVPDPLFPLYCATTLVLALILVVARAGSKVLRRDPFAPLGVGLAGFVFYGVVRGYFLVSEPTAANFYVHRDILGALAAGQLVTALAVFGFGIGYMATARRRRAERSTSVWPERLLRGDTPSFGIVVAFGLVGWAARIIAIQAGNYERLNFSATAANSTVAVTVGNLAFIVTVIALVCAARRREPRWKLLATGSVLTEVGFAVATGVKTGLVILFLAFLASQHYARRPVRFRSVLLVVVLFIGVLGPAIQLDRGFQETLVLGGVSKKDATAAALRRTPDAYVEHIADIASGRYMLHQLMRRTTSIESVALAVRYTPGAGPFRLGREFALAPAIAAIPKPLWPSKPSLTTTTEFSDRYALEPQWQQHSPVGPSLTGDFYLNFGLAGVLLGWAAMGALGAWTHGRLIVLPRPRTAGIVLYVVYLAALIPSLEDTFSRFETGLVQQGLLALVVLGLALSRATDMAPDSPGLARTLRA